MNFLVFTLLLCVFAVTTGEFVIAGILPLIAAELEVSIPAAGLLVTAYAVGMIVGGPLLTALTARFARRRLIMVLIGVAILGNVFSALAPTYPLLFLARVVTALVTSTFFANAIVIATSQVASNQKASTIAKLAFGMNVAMIFGVPLGTWIGSQLSWRFTFVIIAGICAVGLVMALRVVPHVSGSIGQGSAVREFMVLKNPAVIWAIATTAVANAGILAVFTYITPLLTTVSGYSPAAVSGLLLVYGLGAALGNLMGGWLADKSLSRSQVGLLALLAISLLTMWFLSESRQWMVLLLFLVGAISFSVIPGMQARVLMAATTAPTLAIAVNASAYQLSAALAGWYGGLVIQSIGLQALYIVAAIVTCVGVGLSRHIMKTRASHGQD